MHRGVPLRVEKEDEVGEDCGGVCRTIVSVVLKLPEDLMARGSGCIRLGSQVLSARSCYG